MKPLVFAFTWLCLSSCDAFVSLPYAVKNAGTEPVAVRLPAWGFGLKEDTVIVIAPHQQLWVGQSMPKVTGSVGARKRIYRESPGYCGLMLVRHDTVLLGCSHREWKFRGGTSVLTLQADR